MSAEMEKQVIPETRKAADGEERQPAALFKQWSSHPESLERQKWIRYGLVPLWAGIGFLAVLLTGTSGWHALLAHPGVVCWLGAGLVAISLGATATFALLLMMGRAEIATKTQDEDRMPFPWGLVLLAALYWVVPAGLSFAQFRFGVRLVPQQVLFLLNALCFLPLALLLWWVKSAGKMPKSRKCRAWPAFAALYAGLAGLTLLGDFLGWLRGLRLPGALAGLSPLARRAALLTVLVPVALLAWALWRMFRWSSSTGKKTDSGVAVPAPDGARKPWWRRIWEFLFGGVEEETSDPEKKGPPPPPTWLSGWCEKLPKGVRIASRHPPTPDPLPLEGAATSEISTSEDEGSRAFWMLMGGDEARRPTKTQMAFFLRFREAWSDSIDAAKNGTRVSPDLILSGDEGSGRTEAMFATALYAAFARRQRVLYLVSDLGQAHSLAAEANARFKAMFLDTFLSCGVLDAEQAKRWVYAFVSGTEGGPRSDPSRIVVPPNIVIATPRLLERVFFEGRGADVGSDAAETLPAVLRLFEVVMVDDFTELDVVERAHLPFLLHKMRLLLESGNRRPQFVVATPRLRKEGGVEAVKPMLGAGFDAKRNVLELFPRPCEPAWSLPLVLDDGEEFNAVGDNLVQSCLMQHADDGTPLKVVVYRPGLHPGQCNALAMKLVPDPENRKCLRVVAQLDELGDDRTADAVFYPTALSGRSAMAFRLSVGDARTVYVSLSTESEALCVGAAADGVLPALPDSSAVGLRIHHLRSVLRYVPSGQPLDVSVWQRFGVSLDNEGMRIADPDEGAVAYETWRQDEWKEASYGEPRLWPYIVYESLRSTKSNAGRGTDFGLVPVTDEDIVRLGDTSRMGLARPKNAERKDPANGVPGSIARWWDNGDECGAIDLAHAETLVFGRSSMGDTLASAEKSVGSVYTVKAFVKPERTKTRPNAAEFEAEGGNEWRLTMEPWHGSGEDFDIPVRVLEWFLEPGGVPLDPVPDSENAVTWFDLPDFQGIPRTVVAHITGRASRSGRKPPLPFMPPHDYAYEACFAGLLLAPRRLDSKDGPSQIQHSVAGAWNTADGTFSWVLTHLFTGVLARFIPDFSFYALLPVFHQRGRESALAPAIAWIVQPRNTGRTIENLVRPLLQPKGKPDFFLALREARHLFEARPNTKAKLRWLRSFSRSAFECDLHVPEVAEAFERDIQDSLKLLDALDQRLAGESGEIEGFTGPVPALPRDTSWMSAPREFTATGFLDASVWRTVDQLPPPPAIGVAGKLLEWEYAGRKFKLKAGFPTEGDLGRYTGFFKAHFHRRVVGDCYTEYGFNDPYREFSGALAGELLSQCAQAFPNATEVQRAEFLLSFVQVALPYKDDPENVASDWPRHPSETVLRFGGDCEDSSILYAELLRCARLDSAILSIPEHAAVGVGVPMVLTSEHKTAVVFAWLGKNYVYAETANDRFFTPLGSETKLIPAAKFVRADIIPTPVLTEDGETPIRVLNAVGPNSGSLTITLLAVRDVTGPLALAVFARPRKEVFAAPAPDSYPCVGGAMLPPLKAFEAVEATLKLHSPAFKTFWYDVFVCEAEGGAVRGHFVGVGHYA